MHFAIMPLDTPYERLQWVREKKFPGPGGPKRAADAMNIPEATYYGHENGNRGIHKAAQRYASFFGCNVEWLLYGSGTWNKGVAGNPLAGLEGEELENALRYLGTLRQLQDLKRKN